MMLQSTSSSSITGVEAEGRLRCVLIERKHGSREPTRGGLASQDWNGAIDGAMEGILIRAIMQ